MAMKGKNRHAVILGRKGGKKKSERKARAARRNGLLGGDPRKKGIVVEVVEPRELSVGPILAMVEEITIEEAKRRYPTVPRTYSPKPNQRPLNAIVDGRIDHDPKACRIYRCLQCKALGHKDRNRGLL